MALNKIFIHKKDLSYSEVKESDSDITFIRKDALLEWAEEEMMKAAKQSDSYGRRDAFMDVIDKLNSI